MSLSALRVLIVVPGSLLVAVTSASEMPPLPRQVPPILGTAVVVDSGTDDTAPAWRVRVTIPRIRWQVVGEIVPKSQWPELVSEMEETTLTLEMGGRSALRASRIVSLDGTPLTRAEAVERFARATPVLVSVSGEMPEPYYLQLTRPDALIVILGPRDGSPAPNLLPAMKATESR
jgi:hypothetical protein